jgi:general secretion pathway protein G
MIKIFNLKRQQKGFTLIELLVVIVIIGILSSFLLANFVGIKQRARDGTRKSDLRQIQAALELYRSDQGAYPLTAGFLGCNNALASGNVTYMAKIPCDPTNTGKYVYGYASNGSTYDLAACLENVNDSQRDNPINPTHASDCDGGTTNWSYTLHNP